MEMQLKYCIVIIWTVQLLYTTLYWSHCFAKQIHDHYRSDRQPLHKHVTTSHVKIKQHRKMWQRKRHIYEGRVFNALIIRQLSGKPKLWLSDGFDSHHLIDLWVSDYFFTWLFFLVPNWNGYATICERNKNHNATYIYKCIWWWWWCLGSFFYFQSESGRWVEPLWQKKKEKEKKHRLICSRTGNGHMWNLYTILNSHFNINLTYTAEIRPRNAFIITVATKQ